MARADFVRMRTRLLPVLLSTLLWAGCASIASQRLSAQITQAMLNQSDPEIVRAGAPAYLLLLDSLVADAPRDPALLLAGARLYDAYAAALVEDPERRRGLTERAAGYARRALCVQRPDICAVLDLPFRDLAPAVAETRPRDVAALYGYATARLGWIQARPDDWDAVAELPKAILMLQRVVDLEPGFDGGRAQLYLGSVLALRPAALGGDPDRARAHFEQALRYSGGRDLSVKVEYARRYARLVFDQELHDRLLREVLAADPQAPGLTLSNVIAQREARSLLRDDYF
jgi:hypothetical protein